MKKIFFNEDGTIKVLVSSLAVFLVLFLVVIIIAFLMGDSKPAEPITTTTTKKTTTTTIKLCNGCKVHFKNSTITLEANKEVDLTELIDLEKVNVRALKFTIADPSLLEVKGEGEKVILKTLDKVGTTTITAQYDDVETTMNVIVSQNYIASASLGNRAYYAYLNRETPLNLDISPQGMPLTTLDLSIADEAYASLTETNEVIGKQIGETKINLNMNGTLTSAPLYIIDNRILVKLKKETEYEEVDTITITNTINTTYDISIQIEDRNNAGYNASSLKFDYINAGSLSSNVTFIGNDPLDDHNYFYRINLTYDSGVTSMENYSLISISLPDGSKTRVKITR